jgi:TDG/mug DNA glycosylase family protein
MSTRRLRDHVAPDPAVLFVGINPSLRSAEAGHHFASPGNPFWRLLCESGLTPRLLSPEEDRLLPAFGLGITNLCPRPTREASELTAAERSRGIRALRRKVARLRPRVVALVGLTIHREIFRSREAAPGLRPETLEGARVFVLPNPSGRNAAYPGFRQKLVWFEALRAFAPAGFTD